MHMRISYYFLPGVADLHITRQARETDSEKHIRNIYTNLVNHPRRTRGGESGREKRRDESFQVGAKTFVAPFLPARLIAPGSPRMLVKLN